MGPRNDGGEQRGADDEALLVREPTLTTADALAQSFAIGPIVSVGLGMFLVAGAAGAATPFVILVVGAGSLLLGWCVSLYARRFAGAGAVYEYVARTYGGGIGVLAAGSFFLPALIANGTALVTSLLWRDFATSHLGFDPGWWSGGALSIVIVAFLVYTSARFSMHALLAFTAASAIPFLVTAGAILWTGGASGHSLSVFGPAGEPASDLWHALVFGILLFIGFEAAACTGEEATLPHRTIPRAVLLSIGIALSFYLLMAYVATIGFGPDRVAAEWGGNPTAFASLGDRYVGPPTTMLMSAGILLDALAVQVAVFNLFARGYFALARDGLLPRPIARVSPRGTPVGGLAAVVASTLLVLVYASGFDEPFDVFEITATALTLTSLPTFILLALGSPRLVGRKYRAVQALVGLGAATVPVLGIYGTLSPFPTGLRAWGALLSVVMAAAVLAWCLVLRIRRPTTLHHLARHTLVYEQ